MQRMHVAAAAAAIALVLPVSAHAQSAQFQGFGGVTFGDVTQSSTIGGGIAVPLSDNLQIVGEGGRIMNLMPSTAGTLIDLTPVDLRVSAWYGEAGIRVIGSPQHAVRPYGEATAGVARLTTGFNGAGRLDGIANTALGLYSQTEPLLGAGAGIVMQGGPVFVDLGYRYKKISGGDSFQRLLTGGDVHINQVRVGVGVRF